MTASEGFRRAGGVAARTPSATTVCPVFPQVELAASEVLGQTDQYCRTAYRAPRHDDGQRYLRKDLGPSRGGARSAMAKIDLNQRPTKAFSSSGGQSDAIDCTEAAIVRCIVQPARAWWTPRRLQRVAAAQVFDGEVVAIGRGRGGRRREPADDAAESATPHSVDCGIPALFMPREDPQRGLCQGSEVRAPRWRQSRAGRARATPEDRRRRGAEGEHRRLQEDNNADR